MKVRHRQTEVGGGEVVREGGAMLESQSRTAAMGRDGWLVVGVNEGDDTQTCRHCDGKPPHPMTKTPRPRKTPPVVVCV